MEILAVCILAYMTIGIVIGAAVAAVTHDEEALPSCLFVWPVLVLGMTVLASMGTVVVLLRLRHGPYGEPEIWVEQRIQVPLARRVSPTMATTNDELDREVKL